MAGTIAVQALPDLNIIVMKLKGKKIFPIQVHSEVILLLLQQIFIFIVVAADTRAVHVPGN